MTDSVAPSFSDKSVGNELITTLKSKEIENKNRTESITNVYKQTIDITIMPCHKRFKLASNQWV